MALKDDLVAEVKGIFSTHWKTEDTNDVPEPEDLGLDSNHAKTLSAATVLYADLDGSTRMVDNYPWTLAAEVYKSFLRCSAKIIRDEGGTIAAYDGDRVMGIFVGSWKNTSAVRAALKINWATKNIVQSELRSFYATSHSGFEVKHVVGVDTSELHAARIGVRGDNDIVWIGRAANYAAKLGAISGTSTWITKAVYDVMLKEVKFSNNGTGANMWTEH